MAIAGQELVNQRLPTVTGARGTPGYGPAYSGLIDAMLARGPQSAAVAAPAIDVGLPPTGRSVFGTPNPGGADPREGLVGPGRGSLDFSGPTTALFGDETFSDIEPGMFGLGGFSIGTGITPNVPGDYGTVHDVVAFDPGAMIGGTLGNLAGGPIGGFLGGQLGGLATPEVAVTSLSGASAPTIVDVMSNPSAFDDPTVGFAAERFSEPPQLNLRGGPMDGQRGRGGFAAGFGPGSKAAQKRGGGRGGGGFGAAESGKGGIGGRY